MPNHRFQPIVLAVAIAGLTALAACANETPAEVLTQANQFPLTANWNATATATGTAPANATLSIKQYLGFRLQTSMNFTGKPSSTYQWRIFRGDCATTEVADNNTSPTGLLLFETTQSYPDIATDASGNGVVAREMAGSLDSLTAYSVRVRVAQTSSNWDGTKPIACGNLQRTPAG